MKRRPIVLSILADLPGIAADQALLAGLLQVPPETQSDIIHILLNRGNDSGLKGLPALFHKLTPEAQSLVVSNTSRLFGALRSCIHSSNCQVRQNALDIVRRSGNTRLAYLAAHAIHDGSPKIRADAAVSLLELTERFCKTRAETTANLRLATESDSTLFRTASKTLDMLRDERKYLLATLRDALDHYESHHRPEAIEAAMLLAHELESSLFKQSAIKRGKLTHAMLEILSNKLSPRFVPFVCVSLQYPEMRRRIAPRISACTDPAFFAEFIRWHWLARDPAIRRHLISLRSIAWLNDGFEATFNLPADVAPMAPSWILSLGLPSDQKVSLIMNFLIIDNPRANRAAAWALVDFKTPASTMALEALSDHEDQDIRRIAEIELEQRRRMGQHRNRPRAFGGRPEEWAVLLDRSGLDEEFEDFWQNYEHIHPEQGRVAGHHALKFVPGLATQVQIKFLSQQASDRLRALRLTMALSICQQFDKEIFAAANDAHREIRALSMTAIGMIGGETSRRILARALADEEDVVKAAAIDAIDVLQLPNRVELVLPLASSADSAVRAAAVRCLLKARVQESVNALMAMLNDMRADHRCAALWIVDQLKLSTIASRIAKIANSDPDRRIARIALHVARRLQRNQRTSRQPTPQEVSA